MSMFEQMRQSTRAWPGFLLCFVIAIISSYVGHLLPVVGAPIVAILMGILLSALWRQPDSIRAGVSFTSKQVLQFAIILLGANLNLAAVWKIGTQSFWVMIGSLAVALLGGTLIGKSLGLPRNLVRLITVGTSICGASAISAVAPIVMAEEEEIAYAISTIFLFNVIAVFLFPLIGRLFHFSSTEFGIWAGTAINDTSSVVAAGYSFSHAAGQYATVVKLTRSLAIIPVSLAFAFMSSTYVKYETALLTESGFKQLDKDGNLQVQGQTNGNRRIRFPMFILGFIVMSVLDTLGIFGHMVGGDMSRLGEFLVSVALAGVGLNTNVRSFAKTGYRPLLMGLCTWALVAVSSLIIQGLTR